MGRPWGYKPRLGSYPADDLTMKLFEALGRLGSSDPSTSRRQSLVDSNHSWKPTCSWNRSRRPNKTHVQRWPDDLGSATHGSCFVSRIWTWHRRRP